MSIQIFLQGKLLGIDEFLLAPAEQEHDQVFTGRSHWISLLGEILPRALLAELGLSKILLGSSGGGQFLLVLPQESREAAEAFLDAAAREIAALSDGLIKLLWSVTENLGDWSNVLRRLGDVDNFGIRIRRAQTIEEHIQLSVMYKQFFAGELEVLCSMPEFWRKVTVIYSGGDDFAVYGAWDALIGLAREVERLFHRFAETNLKDFAGPEGKTISMSLALEPAADASLGSGFEEAGRRLEVAKSAHKDCIWRLGRQAVMK